MKRMLMEPYKFFDPGTINMLDLKIGQTSTINGQSLKYFIKSLENVTQVSIDFEDHG